MEQNGPTDINNKKKHRCRWWCVGLALLLLYTLRSFLPIVFFKYEPYAEIEAVIPPDMELYVSGRYESYSCQGISFGSGRLVNNRTGWSKTYRPDAEGRVKAQVYERAWGPCGWGLISFSIGTVYSQIPANVLASDKLSPAIKQEITTRFAKYADGGETTAGIGFILSDSHTPASGDPRDHLKLHTVITPSIIKNTFRNNYSYYKFSYDDKKTTKEGFNNKGLSRSSQDPPFKIHYTVTTDNHILYKEFNPGYDNDVIRLLE